MEILLMGRVHQVTQEGEGCLRLVSGNQPSQKGYARITRKRKRYRVTRILTQCPEGLIVMHTCDSPWCVNIDHLVVGTNSDNVRDMINKGRENWNCGFRGVQPSKQDKYAIVVANPDMHFAELAELAGISIPTVYHWRRLSNLTEKF